jgi:hypothetical protein
MSALYDDMRGLVWVSASESRAVLAVTPDGKDLLVANFASRDVQSVAVSSLIDVTD